MLLVCLLGEQAIVDDTVGVVRIRSSRASALLAYLTLHAGFSQTRQRIASLFWPDSTDAQALTNLRRELHNLRQALGDGSPLVITSTDLCWHDDHSSQVDVRLFEAERLAAVQAEARGELDTALAQADSALARYRGELLPGCYDDWVLEPRADLERQCVELCDLVAGIRQRTGELARAAEAVRRRIVLRPLEEAGYRTLMNLQESMGDPAAAVSTYHRCASVLERELGVAPDRSTQQALNRVMTRLRPAHDARAQAVPAVERARLAPADLVGRAHELAALETQWRFAAEGRARLVLVRGGAGVGKTRLVTEAARRAGARGAVVAVSRCFGMFGGATLAPVADWLRHPAAQAAIATLDPVWRTEVERLLPPTAARAEVAAGSRAMVDAWQRHRFLEGLARALLSIGRPTLLVLDDAQWCDHETLAFLGFLLDLEPRAPLLLAATVRDDERGSDAELLDWTHRMQVDGLLTEIALGPLEPAETAHLAAAIRGRPFGDDEAALLQAVSGGFPLYVVEAARTIAERGSAPQAVGGDLGAVLRDRLAEVGDTAREVAALAAAVGTNFTLDLLDEASDLGTEAVVAAVDELWRRRIMREFADGYDFSHDLLRDVAYELISPPRRWLLHRRIAQGLELLHSDDTDQVAALLADQYARGGRPQRAVVFYRRAAETASAVFAQAEAIRLHDKALAIIRTMPQGAARDRQELGVLEAKAAPLNARYGYASPQLQQTMERSLALAEELGDTVAELKALAALWTSRFVQGRTAEAYAVAARALSLAGPESESSGPAHFATGGSAVSLGRPGEALHHFDRAARLSSGAVSLSVGTRPDVHARAWAAHAHWLVGDDDSAVTSCQEAIALARAIDHPYNLAVALAYGAITYQVCHDRAELGRTVDELAELCARYQFAYYREWGTVLQGWCTGDRAGIALAQRGIDNLRSSNSLARMPYWLSLLAELQAGDGQHDAARATLDAALATGHAHDDVWWLPEVSRLRAGYDDDAAPVRLRAAAELARTHGSVALQRRCEHDLAAGAPSRDGRTVPLTTR
jgi:DNA-binding SARP family transcriptional activator